MAYRRERGVALPRGPRRRAGGAAAGKRPRLGAALAALDVPALALSDDADAHRRLYERRDVPGRGGRESAAHDDDEALRERSVAAQRRRVVATAGTAFPAPAQRREGERPPRPRARAQRGVTWPRGASPPRTVGTRCCGRGTRRRSRRAGRPRPPSSPRASAP